MKKIFKVLVSLLLVFTCLIGVSTASADVDITVYPLEITDIRIKHTNHESHGNEVFFEAKFTGGCGPYNCCFYLYDEDSRLVDVAYVGPCYTDGFGWERTFTESGCYCLDVIIEGDDSVYDYSWEYFYIDASPVIELN